MKRALQAAGALALLTLAVGAGFVCWYLCAALEAYEYAGYVVADTAEKLPGEVAATREVLDGRVEQIQHTMDARLASIGRQADARLASLQSDTLRQVEALRLDTFGLVAGGLATTDARLKEVTGTLEGLRGDLRPVLADADEALQQTSGTVAVLRPQLLGLIAASKVTAGHVAQMSIAGQEAFPRFVAIGERFSQDSAGVASNINRLTKPKWYDRLLGYGLNSVVIYRNLHPETNLTIKGAEFISSHPR